MMDKTSIYRSARLLYRGIALSDADDIVRWRSDPKNYQHFFSARAVTMEEHLAWYSEYTRDKTRFDFMIIDDERPIGTVGLSSICEESCEISYMIGEASVRGMGYATEAVEAMTKEAFLELGVEEVIARILPSNAASARVVSKAGFEEAERLYRRTRFSV